MGNTQMSQMPTERNVAKIKAGPNVYTVLLIVAILSLWVGIGFTAKRLMSDPPAGYGVSIGEMFSPAEEAQIDKFKEPASSRKGRTPRR